MCDTGLVASLHVFDPKKIEHVQRSFTKRLNGLKDLSYTDRLKILEVETLERRRLIYDLCTCFKIVHSYSDTCLDINRTNCAGLPIHTRGHNFKLDKELCHTYIRKFFFCNRICDVWNSLAADAANPTSVVSFKKHVCVVNLDRFFND